MSESGIKICCDHRQRSVSFATDEEEEVEEAEVQVEEDGMPKEVAPSENRMFAQQQKQSEEEEEEERRVNLFLCCFSFPLIACARLVGWFSAVPLMFAMLLLPFASTSMLDMAPEIILLGSEMLCVLALFFGVQHQQPNYLRPFLFFGLIWNLALLLLLLFTVIEFLVAPVRFCVQLERTVQSLLHGEGGEEEEYDAVIMPEERHFGVPSHSLALALCFVAILAITILINGWLLHIVLLAYFHMKKLEMESCSSERQQKLLLVVPMRRRTLLADTTPMCYSSLGHTDALSTNFADKTQLFWPPSPPPLAHNQKNAPKTVCLKKIAEETAALGLKISPHLLDNAKSVKTTN